MQVGRNVLLAFALAVAGIAHATPKVGEAPPDDIGKTPDGEEIRISDLRGKVVVVGFWASWCGYCRKQFPVLNYLQEQVGPEHLRVVVINYKEDSQTYRAVRRQLRAAKVTWTHDRNGAISDAFGVSSVPQLFLIDRAGELAHVRRGYSEESMPQLIEQVNALLAEPVPAPLPAPAVPEAASEDAAGAQQ